MSEAIPFTDNYRDLSNTDGYQFEFRCERCGNGYRSAFQKSLRNAGSSIMRGIGGFLGGRASRIANTASGMLDRGTNSSEKDKALRNAVEEISPQFTQCRGCGDWVCEAVCWNAEVGQCVKCSPRVTDELAQLQAKARRQQLQEATLATSYIDDIDVSRQGTTRCPSCDAPAGNGKFCTECGTSLVRKAFCGECGAENARDAKFCSGCGSPVSL